MKALFVDDCEDDTLLIARRIRKEGHDLEFQRVETEQAMARALAEPWDVIISDVNMPCFSADRALALHHRLAPDTPFIVVSGAVGEETAVSYLKGGADDFVLKGSLSRLVPAIERALREAGIRRARRDAEAELRAAKAELERALATKNRFLAAASHDLRQPVQALYCFQDILAARLADHPAAEVARNFRTSLDGLRSLLDSLLDVAKIDSGLIVPDIRPVPLGPLLVQVCGQLAMVACRARVRLNVVPSAAVVETDALLLERILRNLVENAIKYSREGRILVGCRRAGDGVRMLVADTGIGIPETMCSQVFEEFFQVDNPERDRQKGIGLGLSIVQRLCALLGHSVTLRSQVGRGSCFAVSLPVVEWLPPASVPRPKALCPNLFGGSCSERQPAQ